MKPKSKKNINVKAKKGEAKQPWGIKGCLYLVIALLVMIIVIGIKSCMKFYENYNAVGN